MYRINHPTMLRPVSHIIWDIDGTITERDRVSVEVLIKILRLAQSGIYHSFITGRDTDWIIKFVIDPMKRFDCFADVKDKLSFDAEVGCMTISPTGEKIIHLELQTHPLYTNEKGIRDTLKKLVYQPENPQSLQPTPRGVTPPPDIYDANGEGYRITSTSPPPCERYIWSHHKEVFATLEKIRDASGTWDTFDQAPYVKIIQQAFDNAGLANEITIQAASTAIDIVPISKGGHQLAKSWAAGRVLEKLGSQYSLNRVVSQTIAIGDSKSDLDFTIPDFSTELQYEPIPIIYVGSEQNLDGSELQDNIMIQAKGETGPRVASAVLDFLKIWDYFEAF